MADVLVKNFESKIIFLSSVTLFLSLLDVNIVNVSYPVLARVFNVNVSTIAVVSVSFLFALTVGILLAGKINDVIGVKRVVISGYVILIVSGILCAFSTSVGELALFRAFQGFGAAFLSIASTSVLVIFIPPERRGRAFGFLATSGALGLTLGSSAGGILSGYFSWHSVFLAVLPAAAVVMFLYYLYLPPSEEKLNLKTLVKDFDFTGFFIACAGFSVYIYAMQSLMRLHGSQTFNIFLAVAGLVLIYVFVFYEKRRKNPLMDFKILSNVCFSVILTANMLAVMILSMNNFIIPFYLMQILNLSPQVTGFMMVLFSFSYGFFSIFTGKISDRISPYILCFSGMAVAAVTSVAFFYTIESASLYLCGAYLVLYGLAFALFVSPANSAALRLATKKNAGNTTAIFRSTRQISSLMGVVIVGLMTRTSSVVIKTGVFKNIFLIETAMAVASLSLVLYLILRRKA
jgi:MFS family permease